MPNKNPRTRVRLTTDISTRNQPSGEQLDSGDKSVIAIFGNFRGCCGSEEENPLKERRFYEIDRDNYDEVLRRLDVRWNGRLQTLPGQPQPERPIQLSFRELNDFHPDEFVRRIPDLESLREMLGALEDPSRYEEVEAEVMKWVRIDKPKEEPSDTPIDSEATPKDLDTRGLLDSILAQGGGAGRESSKLTVSGDLQNLLRGIVSPHLIKIDSRRQEALSSAINHVLSFQVRAVLQDPCFKALEATWRNLGWLVRAIETGPDVKIRIFQVRKDEILQDIAFGGDLADSELARLLLDPVSVPGTERFKLLIGDYQFSYDLEDLAILERLGNLAKSLQAPFLASASPSLIDCNSFAELSSASDLRELFANPKYKAWWILRRSEPARWLALAMPRILCRLPYGESSEPVESFRFEEVVSGRDHEALLWGNPAFAVAAVLTGAGAHIDSLPLFVYEENGETATKPPAEVLLSERVVGQISDLGLLPLVSYRGEDRIHLPRLQTLAYPSTPIPLS